MVGFLVACSGGGSGGSDDETITVELPGAIETVFDWTTERCEDSDFPDLPVRAFRDAAGGVQIVAGHPGRVYRWVGTNLDDVARDCGNPVLTSSLDTDPSQYDFKEWMGALYTLDGVTIHALVHAEFHGWDASRWFAERDFSAVQGTADWRYQEWDGAAYSDMTFDAGQQRWRGSQPACEVGNDFMHPSPACDPARTWVSPVDAGITISGEVFDLNAGGGDGVVATIHNGAVELWSQTLDNGATTPVRFELQSTVSIGDRIHFRITQRGNSDFDATHFNPKINVGEDPCPSNSSDQNSPRCLFTAITYARSTDGGATYGHPQPLPDHLVASLPLRYEPDAGHFGVWQPSNIVRHPVDGLFYVLIQRDEHRADGSSSFQGMCLMRTADLDDPDSWRAWDGTGFNMRFVDLYAEPGIDPDAHRCRAVGSIGALTYGLSYNTYLEKFVAVGTAINNVPVPGFYFSLSDDLIDWSPLQLIMEAEQFNTTPVPGRFDTYPSLLDPADTSRNFERTGREPYLYFSRFNAGPSIDGDLVRRRIRFNKQ